MNDSFMTIKRWLNEGYKTSNYGCIMMEASVGNWEEEHVLGIDQNDVYEDPEDDSYGLEEDPHVTILYGIHEDEVDNEVVLSVMEENMVPVSVEIDEIDIFENDDYDVVKYNVPKVDELMKMRKLFEDTFPNTQTFPDYNPHVTIAYVKPGKGKKYKRKLEEPFRIDFVKGIYSWHEDEDLKKKKINLEDEDS
jgi:hypothetical protein